MDNTIILLISLVIFYLTIYLIIVIGFQIIQKK